MPRVVVIGGGAAGLWAAKRLTEIAPNQYEVTVLEAGRRWGGRIYTQAEGVELGAQWLHGTHGHPFVPIAQKLGVLDDQAQPVETMNVERKELQRRYAGTRFLRVGLDGAHQILPYNARRSRGYQQHQENLGVAHFVSEKNWQETPSVGDFVRSRLPDDLSDLEQATAHFSEIVNSSIDGDMLSKVSLQHYHVYQELPGFNVIVPGGLSAIVDTQVNVLESNSDCSLHLDKAVTRIDWENQPVRVHCDQAVYDADVVLCTISLGALRDSMDTLFYPPLPPQKTLSVQRMGFGTVNKVILFFPPELARFWDADSSECYTSLGLLPEGVDPHQYETGDAIPSHVPLVWNWQVLDDRCLIGWAAGCFAEKLEKMSDDDIASHCCQFLESFASRDMRPLQTTRVLITRWKSDPHFRGSYSYISCSSGPEDIETLRSPVFMQEKNTSDASMKPVLFFAGEATSPTYFSTMHGAALSGVEAAEQIHQSFSSSDSV